MQYFYVDHASHEVHLYFDKVLRQDRPPTITATSGSIIKLIRASGRTIVLDLPPGTSGVRAYTITSVFDCLENPGMDLSFEFETPDIPKNGDVVINEILFDPKSRCPKFIELKNASRKYVNSNGLYLIDHSENNVTAIPIHNTITIPPDSMIAITEEPRTVRRFFPYSSPSHIFREELSGVSRDSGLLILFNSHGLPIDSATYTSSMHSPFIKETQGISLERISPILRGTHPGSWHSAAMTNGGGTPGSRNSQYQPESPSSGLYEISGSTFTPNGDGIRDFWIVRLFPPTAGYMVTVQVFDAYGTPVILLESNTFVSQDHAVVWNGSDETGTMSPPGMYLALISLMRPDGRRYVYKESIVLAGRFDIE